MPVLVSVGTADRVPVAERVRERVPVADPVDVSDDVVVRVCVGGCVFSSVCVRVDVRVRVAVREDVAVTDAVSVAEDEPDGVDVPDADADDDAEPEEEPVELNDDDSVADDDAEELAEDVPVAVRVRADERVDVRDDVEERVCVSSVKVAVADAVAVCVDDVVAVGVSQLAVAVAVTELVDVGVVVSDATTARKKLISAVLVAYVTSAEPKRSATSVHTCSRAGTHGWWSGESLCPPRDPCPHLRGRRRGGGEGGRGHEVGVVPAQQQERVQGRGARDVDGEVERRGRAGAAVGAGPDGWQLAHHGVQRRGHDGRAEQLAVRVDSADVGQAVHLATKAGTAEGCFLCHAIPL